MQKLFTYAHKFVQTARGLLASFGPLSVRSLGRERHVRKIWDTERGIAQREGRRAVKEGSARLGMQNSGTRGE